MRLLLASEAARELGLSSAMVRYLADTGRLRVLKTEGGVRVFRLEDVRALAVEREKREPR